MDDTSDTNSPNDWFIPKLSVTAQLHQEVDRRAAARLSRDELAIITDNLIQDWYHHTALIDSLLGKVRSMEVRLALSSAPKLEGPKEEHFTWAKQLLDQATKPPSN